MPKLDVELQQRRQAIVMRHLETEDAHDFEACIEAFHRPRYEIIPTGAVYDGHDGVMELLHQNITGFPDFTAEMVAIGHGEDAVFLETRFRGTHLGNWNGIPATGRKLDLPMMLVFLFEEDRMVCERTYFDLLSALRQLGVAPDQNAGGAQPKSFLESYDELSASGGKPQEIAAAQFKLFEEWVAMRPMPLFAQLRKERPIFQTPMATIVSRFADVREVIELDEIFSVQPYGVNLMRNNGGPNFLLGMDDSPQFEKELGSVRLALSREDLPRIRELVQRIARGLIERAKPQGKMEIADDYARLAPTLMVGEYFGVPGPEPKTLSTWVRRMLSDIFLNAVGDPAVTKAGEEACRLFRDYVDRLIAARKAEDAQREPGHPDVLGRLISMQSDEMTHLEDSRIRDMLVGLVCGVLENTAAAVVNIIDWLFDHPEQMQGAVAAAKAGDDDLLLKYVLETLRFHSPVSMMARLCTREHVLAKGTPRATTLAAGTLVYAANGSAMMDEEELDKPEEFRLDRPAHQYLHFGRGLHRCLGKYISQVQVVELVKALLCLPGLRRADGSDGKIRYEQTFPASFVVCFDA